MSNMNVTSGQLVAKKYGLWLPPASNPKEGFDPNMLVRSTLNEKFYGIMTDWLYLETQESGLELEMCAGEGDGFYTSIKKLPDECRDRVLFGLSKLMFHPMGLAGITWEDLGCLIMQYYDRLVYGPMFGPKPLKRMNDRAWFEIMEWTGLSDALQHTDGRKRIRDGAGVDGRGRGNGFAVWMMDLRVFPMEDVNFRNWQGFFYTTSQNTLRNVVLILKHGRLPLDEDLPGLIQRTYESLYNPDMAFWKTFNLGEWEFQLVDYYNRRINGDIVYEGGER